MHEEIKGRGQYDKEYQECPCFWGTQPAKYVKLIEGLNIDHTGTALDIGAGEGKNAFFLQSLGYNVTAIEVSRFACANFIQRMIKEDIDKGITLVLADVFDADFEYSSYDVVVAYGLLHCLPSIQKVNDLVSRMQKATKVGGLNIISAFTDKLPVPSVQDYLSPTLLPEHYIKTLYPDWTILNYEEAILVETHPTSLIEHEHSLFRLIAKRNE